MLKTRTFAVTLALVAILVLGGVVAPGKTLKFGIDADYPPWAWFQEGQYCGLDVDVLRAIIEHFDLDVEWVALPWETAVPALGGGTIDLLAGAMYLTCEREKVVDYTAPYFREQGFVLVKKGSDVTLGTALGAGLRVAGMAGGTQHEWLLAQVENGANLIAVPYETDELALLDLMAGRVDAMVADEVVTYDYLPNYDVEIAGKIYKGYSHEVVYGVRKGDPDNLIPLIDEGLAWLWETGQFQKLWAEHISPIMPPLGPLPLERETICE
jgi:polar amino acid transport system substrate-binding protein